jgi:hypothetical protein
MTDKEEPVKDEAAVPPKKIVKVAVKVLKKILELTDSEATPKEKAD